MHASGSTISLSAATYFSLPRQLDETRSKTWRNTSPATVNCTLLRTVLVDRVVLRDDGTSLIRCEYPRGIPTRPLRVTPEPRGLSADKVFARCTLHAPCRRMLSHVHIERHEQQRIKERIFKRLKDLRRGFHLRPLSYRNNTKIRNNAKINKLRRALSSAIILAD